MKLHDMKNIRNYNKNIRNIINGLDPVEGLIFTCKCSTKKNDTTCGGGSSTASSVSSCISKIKMLKKKQTKRLFGLA